MSHWLDICLDMSAPCVLVTVAAVDGSGPRESGAKMIVTMDGQIDTIGGGHLEHKACEMAREILNSPAPVRRFERFALGPSLGQCCGGVVYLAFELLDCAAQAELSVVHERLQRGEDTWRLVALDEGLPVVLLDEDSKVISEVGHTQHSPLPLAGEGEAGRVGERELEASHALKKPGHPGRSLSPWPSRPAHPARGRGEYGAPVLFTPTKPCHIMRDAAGKRWLIDPCRAHRPHLVLFGAGHVGAAIVRFLAELPCRVTWVDERDDLFPMQVPSNVQIEATDTPETVADDAPAGSTFLVLTHSHALDQKLSEHILQRAGNDWFGLIGSRTKRMQFEHRLAERGITRAKLDAMVCPIGVAGIAGKEPPVIAAAVVAQLLQVWEAQARAVPQDAQPAQAPHVQPARVAAA
jgi:xanthine dehydrogenase accessory factor